MLAVVSGLALDVVIALSFGVGSTTDAFFVAARLPVGVVMVLLSGALIWLTRPRSLVSFLDTFISDPETVFFPSL